MKKILLSICLIIFSASLFAQTGTGWEQIRKKSNFKDEVFFQKKATFVDDVVMYDSLELGNVAVLKYVDTLLVTADVYTLILADDARTINVYNADFAQITIPLETSVAFPNNTMIHFMMSGAGIVKFKGATGVNIYAAKDSTTINTRWGWATLRKRDGNNWNLFGHLED